jgi:predicted acyltransferase (DUF342 family)
VSPEWITALVVAAVVVVLAAVVVLVIVLVKLGRTLDEATKAIRKAHENSEPLFVEANTTLTHVNTQLERVDGITANARAVSGNVSALTSLFTATLGGPLVKAAALSYGISKAVRARRAKAAGKETRRPKRGRR